MFGNSSQDEDNRYSYDKRMNAIQVGDKVKIRPIPDIKPELHGQIRTVKEVIRNTAGRPLVRS